MERRDLAKSAFAHYPVEVEVVEADLCSKIDGVGGCTTHESKSERGGNEVLALMSI
jgi:hypothetical protein